MKALLMFPDRDFSTSASLLPNASVLTKDLELETLFAAMAEGDAFLLEVARRAVLMSLDTPDLIRYRQAILADCLEQAVVVRELYAIAVEALEREKKVWGWLSLRSSPEATLNRSREVLGIYLELLKRLRRIAEEQGGKFRSEGFTRLFQLLIAELSDEFLAEVSGHLEGLALREQMVMSARLGTSNEGVHYVMRKPKRHQTWWQRMKEWRAGTMRREPPSYIYEVPERDEQGAHALGELRANGVLRVAAALGESTEHLTGFFGMLRLELAFYVGCLNLRERLFARQAPFCLPDPLPVTWTALNARGLYDVALRLKSEEGVIGNRIDADEKRLILVTGANRGGKSTFLRSVGQAQLMMQAGLFVGAESFGANVCSGLFTHYKREEDASMRRGKLDEELSRMSAIVDAVKPCALVLCNESFGSTNEREGSEIARQIVSAFVRHDIKVLYVTHMYELAHALYARREADSLFLRAERRADGTRTFRMQVGEPLETSHGADLYRAIFESAREPAHAP